MLTNDQIVQFKANGYLNGGHVLSDDLCPVKKGEVIFTIR